MFSVVSVDSVDSLDSLDSLVPVVSSVSEFSVVALASPGTAITGVEENNTREPKSKPSSARNNFGNLVCRLDISFITP